MFKKKNLASFPVTNIICSNLKLEMEHLLNHDFQPLIGVTNIAISDISPLPPGNKLPPVLIEHNKVTQSSRFRTAKVYHACKSELLYFGRIR